MHNKIVVYIASPYRFPEGKQNYNAIKSLKVAAQLTGYGFIAYPPLWNHFTNKWFQQSDESWLQYDLIFLSKCHCILRLPGYSTGADSEVLYALIHNIPVFYSIKELREHYGV